MPAPALVDEGRLDSFPGGPFDPSVVASAVARVRREARWHIAPSVTETLTVDAHGGTLLLLPTMYLTAVTEVRDVSGDDPVELEDWKWSRNGYLTRCWWPCGPRAVEVDVTHGYAECPDDLLPVIAAAARAVSTDTRISAAGPFQFREVMFGADPALTAYALPQRA